LVAPDVRYDEGGECNNNDNPPPPRGDDGPESADHHGSFESKTFDRQIAEPPAGDSNQRRSGQENLERSESLQQEHSNRRKPQRITDPEPIICAIEVQRGRTSEVQKCLKLDVVKTCSVNNSTTEARFSIA